LFEHAKQGITVNLKGTFSCAAAIAGASQANSEIMNALIEEYAPVGKQDEDFNY
jgi:hypothetical protein